MKILHIIRHPQNNTALDFLEKQKEMGDEIALLLLQDGVYSPPSGYDVYACQEDLEARGLEVGEKAVSYEEIIKIVFAYDKVFTW